MSFLCDFEVLIYHLGVSVLHFDTLYIHSVIFHREMLHVLLHYIHVMLLMYQDLHPVNMITNTRRLDRLIYPAICNSVLY